MRFCLKETYLKMIERSVGGRMFRSSYFSAGENLKDLCKGGELSCAFYVSSLLKIFDLVKTLHTSIDGLEKDLIGSGWKAGKSLRSGSVILWHASRESGGHRHAGFYIGKDMCVSNSSGKKKIAKHGIKRFNGKSRKVEKAYWHPALD